jgi:TRAP-type C4-dicarboxylate transport system permease small subunit
MKVLIKIVEKFVSILFIAMCIVVFVNVLGRYIANKPLFWAEEFSLSVFTWVAFVGAALALRKTRHARVTVVLDLLPPRIKKGVEVFGHVLVAAISVLIFWQSVKFFDLANSITLPSLNVPESVVSTAITFAAALMFIFSVEAIILIILGKNQDVGDAVQM